MIWMLVGLMIGYAGGMLMRIYRMRDTQTVADAAAAYIANRTNENWERLFDALMCDYWHGRLL